MEAGGDSRTDRRALYGFMAGVTILGAETGVFFTPEMPDKLWQILLMGGAALVGAGISTISLRRMEQGQGLAQQTESDQANL